VSTISCRPLSPDATRRPQSPPARLVILATPVAFLRLSAPTGLARSLDGLSAHNELLPPRSQGRQDGMDTARCTATPHCPSFNRERDFAHTGSTFFQEAGIHDLVIDQWNGVFVSRGTQPALVPRLNAEINKSLADGVTAKAFSNRRRTLAQDTGKLQRYDL
jgi:hypothetical protein